jgi:hypothetical protein
MKLLGRAAAPLVITVLSSCSSVNPTAPNGFLTGSWSFVGASVEQMTLALTSSGGTVAGTVVDVWQPSPTPVRGTVTGSYGGGQFTLTLTFPQGLHRWFGEQDRLTGQLLTDSLGDRLQTRWQETSPADSSLGSMVFFRAPAGDP